MNESERDHARDRRRERTFVFATFFEVFACVCKCRLEPLASRCYACQMEQVPPRILFACVENSCRSQMAEALCRMRCGARAEAVSGGSKPSGKVNAKAVASMQALNYDLSWHTSKALPQDGRVDVLVTMGCGEVCLFLQCKKRVAWSIPDPKDLPQDEFDAIRDLIDAKIVELLRDLGI